MHIQLTAAQAERRREFRQFAEARVAPDAGLWEREQALPRELVADISGQGYIGSSLPEDAGGLGLDAITYGLLHEELGWASASVRALLTVQDMVACSIHRWGTDEQKQSWLARLIGGAVVGFALSEPGVGSDAGAVAATATQCPEGYRIDGCKKWISFGQIAEVFLVFARSDGGTVAFLVERKTPGLSVSPIGNLLGMRAAMLAQLQFEGCVVPAQNMVGRPGFGIGAVALPALDLGRYGVACGCVGMAQRCLDIASGHAREREQSGASLDSHQLVQRMLTDMVVGVRSARLMCRRAGWARDNDPQNAGAETWMAKYHAANVSSQVASDAVQILGAAGCTDDSPVSQHYRDAKIMQIIEGTTEVHQMTIARYAGRSLDTSL